MRATAVEMGEGDCGQKGEAGAVVNGERAIRSLSVGNNAKYVTGAGIPIFTAAKIFLSINSKTPLNAQKH